jgi:hypothetical protein
LRRCLKRGEGRQDEENPLERGEHRKFKFIPWIPRSAPIAPGTLC